MRLSKFRIRLKIVNRNLRLLYFDTIREINKKSNHEININSKSPLLRFTKKLLCKLQTQARRRHLKSGGG